MKDKLKVAFIQGRPHGHPAHMKYAQSIKADFYHVDYKIRYHDIPTASAPRRYFSWLLSAFSFPKEKYDVIFSEEAYFMVGLMRWLGLLKKEQKIISLMNTHTLYFLNNNRYAPSTKNASIKLLKTYDAFICGSLLQKELLYNLIGRNHPAPVHTIINGVERERFNKLYSLKPDLGSYNIVFIGAIPNQDRVWYKGLDIMLSAFSDIKASLPEATFTIIGDYGSLKEELLNSYCPDYKSSVFFTGNVNDIDTYLQKAALYLHISRGEAWGISIIEAMAAGVVPIVSESTGAMEAVVEVDKRLITTHEKEDVTQMVLWYFNLSNTEKIELSANSKALIKNRYTEDLAIERFKKEFREILSELQVSRTID